MGIIGFYRFKAQKETPRKGRQPLGGYESSVPNQFEYP